MTATKKAAKKTAPKPAKAAKANKVAQPLVKRSAATTQAQINANPETALYQVLEPFWLNGATVKPTHDGAPVFIEMSAAEAEPYQTAKVLGTEPGEVPETNNEEQSESTGGTGTETAV